MLPFAPAIFCFALFLVGVLRDRRRFSNAVFLGFAVVFAVIGWVAEIGREHPVVGGIAILVILAVLALGIVVFGFFLIANGVQMLRKEGRSLGNLMSLLAGVLILAVIVLLIVAIAQHTRTLIVIAGTAMALFGYVGFLFLCFVGYAFLYGRLRVRRDADYVVVLGSGLIGGHRVPPLLASRLERGRAVHERLSARGGRPVLLTSGGQGPDEELPESHAMADYLVEHGFPADRIEREDRSRTTEENLRFSRALMEKANPDYRCVIVTNNYHAFRAALTARRCGVKGQVVGSPTAAYFWPSATIREFVAVFLEHKVINLGICLLFILSGSTLWYAIGLLRG
ncbi:YdcF family protein [Streptomyces pinistramenti]|uniref:YdcF family protein n=1 Tax=Streptomyces pinistramenti TaxID=2884812 RepID=UPI001D069685|nr:YdcF family protein [Streptomyces pinistramenti]MCB5909115.1 YdcF family protein [Streptomyces pinistramenti]